MTFFGIKLLGDIDLPEFPFPDLGPPDDADPPPPSADEGGGADRARPGRQRYH